MWFTGPLTADQLKAHFQDVTGGTDNANWRRLQKEFKWDLPREHIHDVIEGYGIDLFSGKPGSAGSVAQHTHTP
jgi:hypothetical protein